MLQRFRPIILVQVLAAVASSAALAAPPAERQQLVYSVQHSKYGKIGTYTNTIERQGEITNVTTTARLAVSFLGKNVYRQDFSRRETWQGNRIVDFRGVTTENGKTTELSGRAEGDHFAIMTPAGTLNAPSDVRLANPWSRQAVEGSTMFTPDKGRLETVSIGGKVQATLKVGLSQVRTEHIRVLRSDGAGSYDVWLDEKGVPVQFSVVGDDTITFKLTA